LKIFVFSNNKGNSNLKIKIMKKRRLDLNQYIYTNNIENIPSSARKLLASTHDKKKDTFFFMHKLICFVIELQVVSGLIIISLQIFLHSSLLCATNSSVHLIGTTYLAWPSFLPRKRADVIQNLAKLYTMASVARTHTILIADTWKKGWQDPQLVH